MNNHAPNEPALAAAARDEWEEAPVRPTAAPPAIRRRESESQSIAHWPRRGRLPRWLWVSASALLALAVVSGGIVTLVAHLQTQTNPASAFHMAACPFKPAAGVVEGTDLVCGYLTVPEDHARAQGPTIRLAIAIFKTHASTPAPDPLLIFNGGPGTPLLQYQGPVLTPSNLGIVWSFDRDVILMDQRGVGYSQPSLACTDNETLRDCHDRLARQGINLNDYTTIQNAEDVHDLVRALGYRQVNLYGVSYATRLELTVIRLFPEDLRSVVLDSTYPPQVDGDTGWPAATQRAFDTLFQGCAADVTCNTRYPHLQAVFAQLVTDLNQHPVTQVTDPQTGKQVSVSITGDGLVDGLRNALYDTALIPLLPGLIYQLANHDYSQVVAVSQAANANQGSDSLGMHMSVECSETTLTPQAIPASVQMVEPEIRQYYLSAQQNVYANCQLWNVQPVPAAQRQPVVSAIPTLILAGQYDPTTPPAYGMLAAQTLSKSYFFQFPGMGHVVVGSDSCPTDMFQAFVEHPNQRPDAGCIQQMMNPFFG